MVLKGPSNATDLNVLQGKAYKKPCWPQYIWDQYVLKGQSNNIKEPYSLVYLHMYTLPSSGSEVLRSYNIHWYRNHNDISGKHSTVLKGPSYVFKVRLQCLFFTLLLPLRLKELLASRPVVDTAVLLFIWCRREEFGQFLDTGWSNASMRLFLNVL